MFNKKERKFKYPGVKVAMDGNTAAIMCERESTDAAGAYPITPSTQMGEYWAEEAAKGHLNISDRPLIFIEPEGEHAAAAVTAGLSMTGLRAANFSSGQGIAYMHESLYAAVGKRLTYVLNIGARAMTKSTLNVHAGHDDYHAIDDTGFFQLFAKKAQYVADLNIIAHRIAELSLTPGAIAQDGFLTTHLIESLLLPERELIKEFLGRPDDIIDTPTAAQRIIYGDTRRRIPELWDVDNPMMAGVVQNQDAYMQSVASQRPYFFDHIKSLTDQAFDDYFELTGRQYARVMTYLADDADYLIVGQGSVISSAEAVVDYIRKTRGIKVGVVDMVMFRPFPDDLIGRILKGKKGVTILERLDQPLATDLPLVREIRAVLTKCIENGYHKKDAPYPELTSYSSSDLPALYSGSFGMGSRDLQPEGIIGAIENMLPNGKHKKLFYLSIDFIRDVPSSPKQREYQETIQEAYPHVKELAIHGSENPNLMPEKAITVRFHSVGGWGAITTGKNLAMTLYDLLGYDIKANPKYGSEKKGQPTTYYLAAAPEPIRMNCEYFFVDVVLSPDPNVFKHTNALAGLKKGGCFIIQSEKSKPEEVWAEIPKPYQKVIIDNEIHIFYIDGFKIAREEATDPELQLRMQGIAFQGAFFAASPLMDKAGFTQETLLKAIEDQLQHKFGGKGQRVVDDNMRVVKRGFDEVFEIKNKVLDTSISAKANGEIMPIPTMLRNIPQSESSLSDINRFWEQTGNFYQRGMGNDNITDPFIGLSVMPAASSLFRDMTGIRFEHPEWIPNNCTACGNCYTACPDTAIPGLVSELSDVLDTVVKRVRKNHGKVEHLPKAVRQMESKVRALLNESKNKVTVSSLIHEVIDKTIRENDGELAQELGWFQAELGDFKFALTRPYYDLHEKDKPNSGGLFSITINPITCKGCMECVEVCDDDALRPITQTEDSVAQLRQEWDFWMDLPNTPKKFNRIDDLEEKIGPLETILLNKDAYLNFASGDGACMGCSEKTVVHLFVATVESLMQPRIEKHVAHLEGLIEKLEKHIQQKLISTVNVNDAEMMAKIISESNKSDLTMSSIASKLESASGSEPIDQEWLRDVTQLLAKLKKLKWKYADGTTGKGRSSMGMCNSTGCTSVWGSTWPYNPYPFPWANHLFQDSTSMAMGIFEGHMAKMAEGFKVIRKAELELSGNYKPSEHDEFLTYFTWQQFTDEEWLLCPPVVALGGDGAMYDIGFQNLSRMMASGKPIKVIVVDTQVYSNTGGQACTSGFIGQVSDMAQYGKVWKGKSEPRKEIGLIAMAHRNTYVLQGTLANTSQMIEGFIDGLMTKRPALFNLYTTCQPEHGVADDMGVHQAKLAMESRAYPIFKYNPDNGVKAEDAFDLSGNPAMDKIWPNYQLKYLENGREKSMEVSMTFADFALTEARFRKQFRKVPRDAWNENMVILSEFLEMSEADREGKFPFIWAVDRKQHLSRVMVAKPIVESCEERRDFWIMLRALAGVKTEKAESAVDIESKIRAEVVGKIAQGLMKLAGGNGEGLANLAIGADTTTAAPTAGAAAPNGEYMAPWLETDECTSCDECTKLNSNIFAYNNDKKAFIKNPDGGPYEDLVKAAEKCTARVIHPGLPANRTMKDAEKWIKRGEKFN
ncbi:MAG: 2-oxoacid:acceptor oxidoreductase family protein [Saprospiraceae bacterium]|nr:2-oxoacid:acceptor oxidoreductase family protein [Saprospiraceae bacterium]MCF8250243.1 2-oxoacid:acceptor oxidoreductase family protein [Saprospiraceae bacterium]MCF8279994.1 2-oxoacid:acceptor oxidoreductase family protein [Bacteroidales bacterium]MCF8312051.1 2-oxoacid:acceptor oxidoreductase family protein [Saprospiraceae bacterium]MCF8441148.1 2-oxoacid:acceptor oxidoreductase family protein [Saprospiraceae bacterium]